VLSNILSSFIGAFGGVGAALLLVKWLGGKFIEHKLSKAIENHKHELATQLSHLEAELNRFTDLLSRRNEKAFQIIEGAWERMIRAVGTAQGSLGRGRAPAAAFRLLDEDQALRTIATLPFSQEQKEQLRNASPAHRDDLYAGFDFVIAVRETHTQFAEFKNFLSTRQIFFEEAIFEKFAELRDGLQRVLIRAGLYTRPSEIPLEQRIEMEHILLDELNEKIDSLATVIRARFGFAELPR